MNRTTESHSQAPESEGQNQQSTAEGMMKLGFSEDDLRLIGRDNALTLLPRLKER